MILARSHSIVNYQQTKTREGHLIDSYNTVVLTNESSCGRQAILQTVGGKGFSCSLTRLSYDYYL